MRRQRGFTLLEVLVALAIFGLVAAAVLTASGRSLNNAGRLEELTLAGWIADNRLTELQLAQPTPAVGRERREVEYAGRQWETLSAIEASSDPGLLRVTVWVGVAGAGAVALEERAASRLSGFIAVAP